MFFWFLRGRRVSLRLLGIFSLVFDFVLPHLPGLRCSLPGRLSPRTIFFEGDPAQRKERRGTTNARVCYAIHARRRLRERAARGAGETLCAVAEGERLAGAMASHSRISQAKGP